MLRVVLALVAGIVLAVVATYAVAEVASTADVKPVNRPLLNYGVK